MKFSEYIKEYKWKINDVIKSIYDKKLQSIKNPFLKEYYLELKDYFLAGGKRIRPLLCIATYNAFKDKKDENIIYPSVGTEFLHNASLIHDDIIDKDDFRRGKPAFHFRFQNYHQNYNLKKMEAQEFGNSIGIIGGDSAFIMGLEAYFFNNFDKEFNLQAIKYYEQAFLDIISGVLIETDMVNQTDLTLSDYIEMVSLKTGALIEKSILIGANYANVSEEFIKYLSIYGTNVGIIFQIIDDILGTFGDENITGKPTDGDIRENKLTALKINALNGLNDSKKSQLLKLLENPNMNKDDVEKVKELFIEADAINSCKELANKYYQKASSSLDDLKSTINQSEAEFFENLLNFVIERKF
ncbi:MAG: polyprenyl synthetase family protein [Candidatus Lokiarchaeota archaeon]|nr:polyprenyl synthetase family protein [Candidatus Lokiarchaeota archaeon]